MIYYGLREFNIRIISDSVHKFMLQNLVATSREYKLGVQHSKKALRLQGNQNNILIPFEKIKQLNYTMNYVPKQSSQIELKVNVTLEQENDYTIHTIISQAQVDFWQDFLKKLPQTLQVEQTKI